MTDTMGWDSGVGGGGGMTGDSTDASSWNSQIGPDTSTASTGVAGSARNWNTFGHDTHPRFKEPAENEDPSRHFFNDRRSEGRRSTPR